MQAAQIPPNPLAGFIHFDEYADARPQFFPKKGSRTYFLRYRADELREQQILVKTPAGDMVDPAASDDYILDLFRRGETYRRDLRPIV